MFYALVIIQSLMHLLLYTLLAIYPQNDPAMLFNSDYSHNNSMLFTMIEWVAQSSEYAIGCLIVVQMFQLTISLRRFLNKLSIEEADQKKKIIYTVAIIAACLETFLLIFVPMILPWDNRS